jgi:hypothetical protein
MRRRGMIEAELVICNLRSQVRNLQSLLNYLEAREVIGHEDYSYVRAKLQEVIGRLRDMERFSGQRREHQLMRAQWLN